MMNRTANKRKSGPNRKKGSLDQPGAKEIDPPKTVRQAEKERDLEELQQAFAMFDIDGNGSINRQELATAMRVLGGNPTEAEITQIMNTFDKDKNNVIDFDEFCQLMHQNLKDPKEEETELREAFAIFDKNGDGYVDASEIKAVMKTIGQKMTDEEIDEMISCGDNNGDGKLNYDEFAKIMAGCNPFS